MTLFETSCLRHTQTQPRCVYGHASRQDSPYQTSDLDPACTRFDISAAPSASRPDRRPALVPQPSSLYLAETPDLTNTRTCQPLIPPPDPRLINQPADEEPQQQESGAGNQRPPDPPRNELHSGNPTSSQPSRQPDTVQPLPEPAYNPLCVAGGNATHADQPKGSWSPRTHSNSHLSRPADIGCPPCARLSRTPPHSTLSPYSSPPKSFPPFPIALPSLIYTPPASPRPSAHIFPYPVEQKRKHSAFLLDEERRCSRDAAADTPHLSEMAPGERDEDVIDDVGMGLGILGLRAEGFECSFNPFSVEERF